MSRGHESRALRALIGVAVAVFFVGASCGSPLRARVRVGELVVRRVTDREVATRVGGVVAQSGDWVLEGPSLRVVIGGLRHHRSYCRFNVFRKNRGVNPQIETCKNCAFESRNFQTGHRHPLFNR